MPASPPAITGYTFHRELGRGAHGVVYEASKGGERYAVKVLPASAGTTMRREAAAMARLRHAALTRVFEIGHTTEISYLVMELVRGDSLAVRIASGRVPEPELLGMFRALAGALRVAHHAGLVHRDIKPENVLLGADGSVKLVDFGFAADAAQLARDDAAVGTFLYASPEQAGRLATPVDARSDLYALGAAIYHAAVGAPPYRGETIPELVRRHASSPVPDPSASGVSSTLAAILQKLLAKDPRDRYQTARGLAEDLDQLDALDAARARGELVLDRGSRTFADDRASLIGRDRELAELAAASAAALDGRGSVALIEGEPGCGKSRLARELVERARRAGRRVLQAKATEGDPRPFAALRGALGGLVADTRGAPPAAAAALGDMVRAAAGDALDVVVALVPELVALVGTRPAPELGKGDREQAFGTLSAFVLRLASETGGLVMLLDDVQWLDDASLQVLRRVIAQLDTAPLWLLATQRDEPSAFRALLGRAITADGTAHGTAHGTPHGTLHGNLHGALHVALGPLEPPAIASIIGDHLGGHVGAAVVELVAARSRGNPLVTLELARACVDAGVLQPSWGGWRVDRAAQGQLVLPGDVLGLIGRRVDQLGATTRRVLSVAAVAGNRFSFELVRDAAGPELADHLVAALSEAIGVGLIELAADGRFELVHDRIRENLLAELAPADRQAIHDRLAEAQGAGGAAGDGDDAVFAVAHHLAHGAQADPRRTALANLRAGLRALAVFADDEALGFLDVVGRMQRDHGQPPDPRHDAALGEAHLRIGEVELAIHDFRRALDQAIDPLERAELRERLTKAHVVAWDMTEACRELDLAYRELGEPSPGVGLWSILRCIALWIASVVIATTGLGFGTIRGDARARMKVIAELCDSSVFIGIMSMQTARLIFGTLRMLHAARRLGPSRELVIAYGDYAAMMGVLKRVKPAEQFARHGLEVARSLGERPLIARAMMNAGGAARFYGGEQLAEQRLVEALETHGKWLDADGFVFGAGMLFAGQLIRGYSLEALHWVDALTEQRGRTLRTGTADHPMIAYGAAALAQLGRGKEAGDYASRAQACVHPADIYSRGILAGLAAMAALEAESGGDAALDRAIAERRALALPPAGAADVFLRYFYVVQAYGRLRQRLAATGERVAAAQAQLELAARELRKAAHLPVLRPTRG